MLVGESERFRELIMDSVLVYHSISTPAEAMPGDIDISPARFEQQLAWLRNTKRVVRLEDALARKSTRQIAITFDDGYRDNLTAALPLLEKYNLPMTLFMVAGFVDSDGYLSADELREISRHPLITIGAHGLWHRHFNRISRDEARFELTESRRLLEETIETKVDLMAWPYGECTPALEELAGECGYRAAWSVWKGSNSSFSHWRVPLGRNDHMLRFVAKCSGLYGLTEARLHRYQERRRQASARATNSPALITDVKTSSYGSLDAHFSRPEVLK
jgi:peptidoglycan/xylan/chitin deacetylase (PgdA/CDA1 family)